MATTIDMFPGHRVPLSRPFIWLGRGWDDLRHGPLASLAYGWLIASLGALILAYSRHPVYLAAAIAGFLLVGPVVTAGVCELSRRRDHGETMTFQESLRGLFRSVPTIKAHLEALLAQHMAKKLSEAKARDGAGSTAVAAEPQVQPAEAAEQPAKTAVELPGEETAGESGLPRAANPQAGFEAG